MRMPGEHGFLRLRRLTGHDADNLFVCFPHAQAAQTADVGDGVFHALGDDALAAKELLLAAVHVVAKQTRIHGGGDLGGAGGLGPSQIMPEMVARAFTRV